VLGSGRRQPDRPDSPVVENDSLGSGHPAHDSPTRCLRLFFIARIESNNHDILGASPNSHNDAVIGLFAGWVYGASERVVQRCQHDVNGAREFFIAL
jgi:hypothetical protein